MRRGAMQVRMGEAHAMLYRSVFLLYMLAGLLLIIAQACLICAFTRSVRKFYRCSHIAGYPL